MDTYIKPEMQIIIFDSEDVIATSGPDTDPETGLPIIK